MAYATYYHCCGKKFRQSQMIHKNGKEFCPDCKSLVNDVVDVQPGSKRYKNAVQ